MIEKLKEALKMKYKEKSMKEEESKEGMKQENY